MKEASRMTINNVIQLSRKFSTCPKMILLCCANEMEIEWIRKIKRNRNRKDAKVQSTKRKTSQARKLTTQTRRPANNGERVRRPWRFVAFKTRTHENPTGFVYISYICAYPGGQWAAAAAIKAPLIKANFNNLHSSRELYWLKLLNQNRDGNKGSQTEIEREREKERES